MWKTKEEEEDTPCACVLLSSSSKLENFKLDFQWVMSDAM